MTLKSFIITAIVIAIIIGSVTFYLRSDPNDSLPTTEINFSSSRGDYSSFTVNLKDSNSVKIKGHLKYDIFEVHAHYNLKDIDRAFVYRQVKAVCEANMVKVSNDEFKYMNKEVHAKIIADLNRIGIDIDTLKFE